MEGVLSELIRNSRRRGNVVEIDHRELMDYLGIDHIDESLMDEIHYELSGCSNIISIQENTYNIELILDESRECSMIDYEDYLKEEMYA